MSLTPIIYFPIVLVSRLCQTTGIDEGINFLVASPDVAAALDVTAALKSSLSQTAFLRNEAQNFTPLYQLFTPHKPRVCLHRRTICLGG